MEIRRQLLRLTLVNARRSVGLMLLAAYFVSWEGWHAGAPSTALIVALLATASASWRFHLGGRETAALSDAALNRLEIEVACNSLLAGLLWAAATVTIYPILDPRVAAEHLVVLVGSAALAAHFMTLVPWAYSMLVVPSIGSLVMVSLIDGRVRSPALLVLSLVYMATLLVAGRTYRRTATQAIAHSIDLETAMVDLQKAKEDAEAGALAKSQFLATMSHEIRTPMNGVLGSLELLRRSGLTEEQRRLARTAASSGTSLMAILNDVLDHSKIEAGKLQLAPAPTSLHDLIASVAELFQGNAEARGLWLRLKVDDQVPDWVLADGQRLKQVLLNLVSNAIKFTDNGGVTLAVKSGPATYSGAELTFYVRDTGVGLNKQASQRLFSPFTQLEQGDGKARSGTGLGLSISQRIVEAMGGRIEVDSVESKGSEFRFSLHLPLHHEAPVPIARETDVGSLSGTELMAGTVLVAEDNLVNRLIAKTMLESLGLTVVEAEDGVEALAVAQKQVIDLVFMDCQMPNLDGFETTRRWRERELLSGKPRTPIVALTANAFGDDIARVRNAGMDGHLTKPYTRRQLQNELAHWL